MVERGEGMEDEEGSEGGEGSGVEGSGDEDDGEAGALAWKLALGIQRWR